MRPGLEVILTKKSREGRDNNLKGNISFSHPHGAEGSLRGCTKSYKTTAYGSCLGVQQVKGPALSL